MKKKEPFDRRRIEEGLGVHTRDFGRGAYFVVEGETHTELNLAGLRVWGGGIDF